MQRITQLFVIFTLQYFTLADLQFGKVKPMPPETDSSAQYRSVIMPKIFGGGVVEKPLKTGNGPYQRQRYYKPTSNVNKTNDCPMSPYATYLSEADQADLYILVKSARDNKVDEDSIKALMEEYARNSMSPEKFAQFQKDNQAFEVRLERLKRDRARRTVSRFSPRLFSKQKPKGVELKSRRQVKERLSDAFHFTNDKNKLKRVTATN